MTYLISIIASKPIHVVANGNGSFFSMADYSIVHMYHVFFIYSPPDRHLGYFHTLTNVSDDAMNTGVHVPF